MKLNAKELIITALFTALMAAGALIRIPFPLLPVTLQTFICALAGLVLGPKLGSLSMAVYALLGLIGAPVFANGGGIAYIFDKSFGFVIGFIAGAAVIGILSSKFKKPTAANNLKALIPGLGVIYTAGILHMHFIMRVYLGNENVGLFLIVSGNIPYLIKDVILFILTAFMGSSLLPAIRHYLQNKVP